MCQFLAMVGCAYRIELGSYASDLATAKAETLLTLFLDRNGKPIGSHMMPGLADHVTVPFRTIVGLALQYDAADIVLAHNHPSGDARPSRVDIIETHRLERLLFPLNIGIADHVILANGSEFWFRDAGLL